MSKYFGTDGFRGEAGIALTADHAYKVGRFLGWYYNMIRERNGDTKPCPYRDRQRHPPQFLYVRVQPGGWPDRFRCRRLSAARYHHSVCGLHCPHG